MIRIIKRVHIVSAFISIFYALFFNKNFVIILHVQTNESYLENQWKDLPPGGSQIQSECG